MSYIGSWKIDDLLTFVCNTQVFATGVATDADSVPSYRVYEDETTTPILTGTMALLDSANTAGFYSEQITLSAANGFEQGKSYSIYIAATVSSVAGATNRTFQIGAEVSAAYWKGGVIPAVVVTGVPLVDVKYLLGTVFATPATAGIPDINVKNINNVVAATPGATGGLFIAGTNAATTVTTSLTTTFTGNLTGSVASVTAGVTLAATAVQAIWDALTSALTTVGSIGKLIVDNLNAAVGSVPSANANADALLDRTNAIETSLTPRGLFRLAGAALAGKLSGGSTTTNTFRNAVADSKDRITATVDSSGNRTAITTDTT